MLQFCGVMGFGLGVGICVFSLILSFNYNEIFNMKLGIFYLWIRVLNKI